MRKSKIGGDLVFGAMINQYMGVAIAIDPFQVVYNKDNPKGPGSRNGPLRSWIFVSPMDWDQPPTAQR